MRALVISALVVAAAACGSDATRPLETAQPGVVFAYPVDGQVDVPLGTRVIVTFSEPVVASALTCSDPASGAFCIVGPNGPVAVTPQVSADGKTVLVDSPGYDPGTPYQVIVRSAVDPDAQNLPSGPLVTFTTRAARPRAAAPALVAVNGGDPMNPESFRPMFETSTIRLVFSEPLDPRTVALTPGSIELLDPTGGEVPATVIAKDVHVSIDPVSDLTAGTTYTLRLGTMIHDLGGQALAQTEVPLTPRASLGSSPPIPQVLRTRQPGDPGTKAPRTGGATNTIELDKPLIGKETAQLAPSALAAELGDPKALDGPIAFTIRRGQRLRASGLTVSLGGQIPTGLSTGDMYIELLTDGGGRMYRNPHQSPDQRPENDRAPVYVDFSLDVAVYAVDPEGNAVLTQTVLGLQAAGIATATDGVLDIETAASMDLGLLGVTSAPSNLVLELITDSTASPPADTTPPSLVATFPAASSSDLPVDAGIELIFSEPIDLDRARAGGLELETDTGVQIPAVIESHGAAVVLRPVQRFAYGATYHVAFSDVRDVAGNPLTGQVPLTFHTPPLQSTAVPLTVTSAHPGAPCALDANDRCVGGQSTDDTYAPFTLPANDVVRVDFSQPIAAGSIQLGTQCGAGDVRVEQLDGSGACTAAVPGTLIVHDRGLEFVPDVPWTAGTHYRVTLLSGGNTSCDSGDVCGLQRAASWDPLNGTTSGDAGGPPLAIDFTAAPPTKDTIVFATTSPFTDINGSGFVDGAELPREENEAAMRITGTSGAISSASFNGPDCVPSTPQNENCIYLQGAMPTALGEVQQGCTLPDGTTAAACVPVVLDPEAMYGTSISMSATVGFSISTDTGTSVMRLREPSGGPITGYIVDAGGMPDFVVALDLYMDAPDMSIPLSSHDLHSKPLSLVLRGPVTFLPDGRISIAVANVADVPLSVHVSAPLGVNGDVHMLLAAGLMKLQLISPPVRGAPL